MIPFSPHLPMNNLTRIALAMLAVATPVVAAAAANDSVQPDDVFVSGMNIEWNEHHLQVFDAVAHRSFHVEWAKREREWLADHESNQPGFSDMRRMWVQERNLQHRGWHRRQAAHEEAMTFMEASVSPSTSGWTTIAPKASTYVNPRAGLDTSLAAAGDVEIPARFYTERLSRRFIRALAEARIAADLKVLMQRQELSAQKK